MASDPDSDMDFLSTDKHSERVALAHLICNEAAEIL